MGQLEQAYRDDWRLAQHLVDHRANDPGSRENDTNSIREHLKDSRKCNGWTNYETWSVNLLLSNEQGLDEACRELVREVMTEVSDEFKRVRAADALKDWAEEWIEQAQDSLSEHGGAGMLLSQLASAALSEVDWLEMADAFAPEQVTA